MNTRFLAIAVAVSVLAFGYFATQPVASTQQLPPSSVALLDEAPLQYAGSIKGSNSEMLPAPGAYVIACLPANYQNDVISQKLIKDLREDPTMLRLRQQVATRVYTAGHPILEMLNVKTTPALIVLNGTELTFKVSGPAVEQAAEMISDKSLDTIQYQGPITGLSNTQGARCIKFIKNAVCVNCPKVTPKTPGVDPDSPKNKEPELLDTVPRNLTQPALPVEDNFLLVAVAVGAVAAGVRYFST